MGLKIKRIVGVFLLAIGLQSGFCDDSGVLRARSMREKLDAIIIRNMEFRHAAMVDVLDYLSEKALMHNGEPLNIVYMEQTDKQPNVLEDEDVWDCEWHATDDFAEFPSTEQTVTLSLKNVSLKEALMILAELNEFRLYVYNESTLLFAHQDRKLGILANRVVPLGTLSDAEKKARAEKEAAFRKAINQRLDSVVLPTFSIEKGPLQNTADKLMAASSQAPDLKQIMLLLAFPPPESVDPAVVAHHTIKKEHMLEASSLRQILDTICREQKLTWSIQGTVVLLHPKDRDMSPPKERPIPKKQPEFSIPAEALPLLKKLEPVQVKNLELRRADLNDVLDYFQEILKEEKTDINWALSSLVTPPTVTCNLQKVTMREAFELVLELAECAYKVDSDKLVIVPQ